MSAATPTPPTGPASTSGPPPAAPPTGVPPTLPSVPGAPAGEAPHHHQKTEAELAALEIQDNALYRGLKSFWAKAKSGELLPSKVLAVIVVVVVAGGLYWWFSGQSLKADSRRWSDLLARSSSAEQLVTFAADNPDTTQALLARRNRALMLLGPDGTIKLESKSAAEWKKAVQNVEAARDELTTLADLFRKDRSLKAACFRDAAVAERALIGVPKKGPPDENPANQRGTAAKVAELYRSAAAAIGANTASGEKYTKEAADVEANAATILSANAYFYSRVAPEGMTDTPTPAPNPTPGANPNPQTPSTSRTPSTGK